MVCLIKIKAYALQDAGYDTIEANELLGFPADMRVFSQCAEIVRNLGISRVRAMTANPKKIEALRNAGLEVVERVATEVEVDVCAQRYLETKRERMGHFTDVVKCHKTPPVRIAPR